MTRKIPILLVGIALLKLAIHFLVNASGGYGYFRDELYYIACTNHLATGYVDQPPLSIYLLAINRFLFGDSIFALRLLPALAGAFTVFLSGLMARELGGRKFAQALAAVAAIGAPIYFGMNTTYSMNNFDILLWAWGAYILIRLLKTQDSKYWLLLGLLLGFGLLNKIGVLWFGFGIFVGIVLTSQRSWLKTKWPYLCAMVAFLMFSPYILWNLQNDLATLEFMRNASGEKYSTLTPISFLAGQIILMNPFTLPVWLAGLFFLFRSRDFRLLAFVYLGAMLILILNVHTKAEYLSPAYTMLFAAGGVSIERWMEARSRRWLQPISIGLLLVSGAAMAPMALPALPVDTYIRYAAAVGVEPSTAEHKELAELPQYYADMFGWESKAEAVAKAYHALSPEEQSVCAIFANNYGRCAAIDFFGKQYGLPDAIGDHNNYWIWGPRNYTGEVVIILGGSLESKQQRFESVEVAGVAHCDYCMPYEKDIPVYVCRKLNVPLKELWPQLKHFE